MESDNKEVFEFKAVNDKGDSLETLDQFSGFAKVQYSDGSQFEGNFVEGFRDGLGRVQFLNGDVYEGSFV